MMKPLICMAMAVALVAGCEDNSDRLSFEGQFYRAKLKRDGDAREVFTVAVSPVSRGIKGALEAGRYEATEYCITEYGSSRIDWTAGPDQDPEAVAIDNDTLVLSGACPT